MPTCVTADRFFTGSRILRLVNTRGELSLMFSAELLPVQIKLFDVLKESIGIVSKISKFRFLLWQIIEKMRKLLAYALRTKFD